MKDLEIHRTPGVEGTITVRQAWNLMRQDNVVTLPITKDNKLQGLITIGDIAESFMDVYDNTVMATARTQYKAIAETLDGTIVVGNPHGYFMKGRVLLGASYPALMENFIQEDDLVIMGNRSEDHLCAMEQNASCIIVCMGARISPMIQKLAEENDCVIISTPHDTYTVARLINQSIPIKFLMKTEKLITFKTDDFTTQIKETMGKYRHRDFPVLDKRATM